MKPQDLNDASRDALSRLLACDTGDKSLWDAADLQAILSHQLNAEMEFDLTHFGGVARETIASIVAPQAEKRLRTFGQLLADRDPPLEMLDMVRRFAKRSRATDQEGMPEEIATALYYAAIAAARLHHKASISKLDDQALLDGLNWGVQQPWMADLLKNLFAETIEAIRQGDAETHA